MTSNPVDLGSGTETRFQLMKSRFSILVLSQDPKISTAACYITTDDKGTLEALIISQKP